MKKIKEVRTISEAAYRQLVISEVVSALAIWKQPKNDQGVCLHSTLKSKGFTLPDGYQRLEGEFFHNVSDILCWILDGVWADDDMVREIQEIDGRETVMIFLPKNEMYKGMKDSAVARVEKIIGQAYNLPVRGSMSTKGLSVKT